MTTLNPSNAARRVNCAGSHKLEQPFKNIRSAATEEGISAHKIATHYAKNEGHAFTVDSDIEITEEMIEGAQLYAGCIREHFGDLIPLLHFEEEIKCPSINPNVIGRPDCWGVLDALNLHIYEYKFGHSFVEVYENWQLIEYASGIIDSLGINGLHDQHLNVHMHIIQPRSFHPDGQIRTWSVKASALRPYFNILQEKEHAALDANPITSVSSECNHCTARHVCISLQKGAMAALDITASAIPHNLRPEEIGVELRFLNYYRELLDSRISGLSAEALALIQNGERIPNFQAVRGKGRDRWTKPQEEIIALGDLYGVDLRNIKLVTPKLATSSGLDKSVVEQYSETPLGALKLAPIDTRKTDKIFGGNND